MPTPSAIPRSGWAPLQRPVFRALWIATIASNVGTWMHDTAATWLMTGLTSSTLLVAMMQTASSLPVLFLALPAGALADIVDRRRVLLITQTWMLLAAASLAVTTMAGWMTPGLLLLLTFLLGLGTALNTPAWQATVPDLVPLDELPSAVALNGISTNIARAIGPAVGGLLVAAIGSGGVFLLNAASFTAMVLVLRNWKRIRPATVLPAERVAGAMRAGVRYARHAPAVKAALARTAIFIVAASALWALLPVVARHEMQLDAIGYGVLLGSLGAGAIVGGLLLPRFRSRWTTDRLVVVSSLVFAGAMAVVAVSRIYLVLCAALVLAGIAWMTAMPLFNVATQRASPDWARARTMAIYVLAYQGGMAAGSFGWGVVASRGGVAVALGGAALVGLLGAVFATRPYRLEAWEGLDLTPSDHMRQPIVEGEVPLDAGPVLVTVEYRIDPANAEGFARAMDALAQVRLRDGALNWGLYRDTAEPGRFLETFVSETWGEHLRQHARGTMADRRVMAAVRAFYEGPEPPVVAHLIHVATTPTGSEGHRGWPILPRWSDVRW